MKPWSNNPAFYVTVFSEESDQPAREGPFAWGAVELFKTRFKREVSLISGPATDNAVGKEFIERVYKASGFTPPQS